MIYYYIYTRLMQQKMEKNYMEWMEKTLDSERAEWNGDRAPEVEPHSSAYHTHAPVIIFQMIDQNLQVRPRLPFVVS